MISYPDFRAAWRTHMADEGADALLRRFLILAARHGFPDARATRVGMQPQQFYSRFFQRRKPGFAKIFIQQYKSLFQSIYPVIFKFL